MSGICRESKASTIYLLQVNGYASTNCFRAIDSGHVKIDDVILSLENFIKTESANSVHLKALNLQNVERSNYKFTTAQHADIIGTINAIIQFKCNTQDNETHSQMIRQTANNTIPNEPILDHENLQEIVDQKLSKICSQYQLLTQHFPIINSIGNSFPYTLKTECPVCHQHIMWKITLDKKANGKKYITYRHYIFSQHLDTHAE